MSSTAGYAFIPLPELAHTRESPSLPANTASCTPYSCPSTRSARKDRDLRRRTYMRYIERMMAREPTSEDLEDPFLRYFETQRVEYGEDASCVFLLWGHLATSQPSTCPVLKARDIPIKSTGVAPKRKASEERVFLDMRRAFYKHTKSWTSHLGLRTISSLKPIKVDPPIFGKAMIY